MLRSDLNSVPLLKRHCRFCGAISALLIFPQSHCWCRGVFTAVSTPPEVIVDNAELPQQYYQWLASDTEVISAVLTLPDRHHWYCKVISVELRPPESICWYYKVILSVFTLQERHTAKFSQLRWHYQKVFVGTAKSQLFPELLSIPRGHCKHWTPRPWRPCLKNGSFIYLRLNFFGVNLFV